MLTEAKLPDFVIDLFDQYGFVNPRPSGPVINFQVIHENTTYQIAKNELEAVLELNGVRATMMEIKPGPEVKTKINRTIRFSVARQSLL